jgi:intein-encoded DNA endonuclease-like protein
MFFFKYTKSRFVEEITIESTPVRSRRHTQHVLKIRRDHATSRRDIVFLTHEMIRSRSYAAPPYFCLLMNVDRDRRLRLWKTSQQRRYPWNPSINEQLNKTQSLNLSAYRTGVTLANVNIDIWQLTEHAIELGILSSPFTKLMSTNVARFGRACETFQGPNRHEHSEQRWS